MDISYLFAAISVLGYIFNIQDKKFTSYIIWLIANICWVFYYISIDEGGSVSLFIVYSVFCIYGIFKELDKETLEPRYREYKIKKVKEEVKETKEIIEKVP